MAGKDDHSVKTLRETRLDFSLETTAGGLKFSTCLEGLSKRKSHVVEFVYNAVLKTKKNLEIYHLGLLLHMTSLTRCDPK